MMEIQTIRNGKNVRLRLDAYKRLSHYKTENSSRSLSDALNHALDHLEASDGTKP